MNSNTRRAGAPPKYPGDEVMQKRVDVTLDNAAKRAAAGLPLTRKQRRLLEVLGPDAAAKAAARRL